MVMMFTDLSESHFSISPEDIFGGNILSTRKYKFKYSTNEFRKELRNEMKDIGVDILNAYNEIIEYWQGSDIRTGYANSPGDAIPVFKLSLRTTPDIEIIVRLKGDTEGQRKYQLLNSGTSERWAVMSKDWKSKTVPNDTRGSNPGAGKVVIRGKRKMLERNMSPQPGIEGRYFGYNISTFLYKMFYYRIEDFFMVHGKPLFDFKYK